MLYNLFDLICGEKNYGLFAAGPRHGSIITEENISSFQTPILNIICLSIIIIAI